MKSKGIPVYANKFEYTVNAPLQEVVSKFFWIAYDPEHNHNITTSQFFCSGEGSSFSTHFIVHMVTKIGGIFQEREICLLMHHFKISDDTHIITQEHSHAIPANKKFIRITFHLSGILFKALSATSTQVSRILHGVDTGSIPKCSAQFFFLPPTF